MKILRLTTIALIASLSALGLGCSTQAGKQLRTAAVDTADAAQTGVGDVEHGLGSAAHSVGQETGVGQELKPVREGFDRDVAAPVENAVAPVEKDIFGSESARAQLNRPVNCSTAGRDIATLEQEKSSVGQRIASGVTSVFPYGAAAALLGGNYSERVQVATGQYNADIEARIAVIRRRCGR